MRPVGLFLWFLIGVAVTVDASAGRRVALVIGNSDYTNTSSLANPVNDANLMAQTLTSVGFEVTRVTDADQLGMRRAMLEFGRDLRNDVDASLFYYAGHGVQARGQNYLIPVDAMISDESELDFQAIDVNAFLRVMESSSSRINIVVLDACRNNPFASQFRSAARGLAMLDAPKGTYIAYSTAPGEVAEDGTTGNSPYTTALAAAITRQGLRIEDTFKQARRTVLEITAERQVPWETSSITGDFYFLPGESQSQSGQAGSDQPAFRTDTTAALAWAAIQNSTSPSDYEAFIGAFGALNPFLKTLAESRISALSGQETAALIPPSSAGRPAARRGSAILVPQTGHFDWIRSVAWSPDGRKIATAADDQSVRIWDVATGVIVATYLGHSDWVYALDWSPDGRRIASVDRDGQAIIWDYETGRLERTFQAESSGLLSVAWSRDGTELALGGYGGAAELWDADSGQLIRTFDGHSDWIRSVAWSPDGRWLATGSDDGSAKVWDVRSGALIHTLSGHTDYIRSVAWSPDGRYLATGGDDKLAKIWDARSGTLLHTLDGFDEKVVSVAWSPDSRILATSDDDLSVKLFDGDSGRLLRSMAEEYETVQSVAWSPDGRVIATGGSGRLLKLWDPSTGTKQASMETPDTSVQAVAMAPVRDWLAVVNGAGDIDIWDLSLGRHVRNISVDSGSIQAIEWSPDGQALATGGSSQQVRIYDTASGVLLHDLSGHSDWVRSVSWSPNGAHLVSAGDDNTAIVWNASNGSRELVLEGHTDWIRATAWSPDGDVIATGADDKEIRVWNAHSGARLRTMTVESWARSLMFSPNSQVLLSTHGDSKALLWNIDDGSVIHELPSDGGSILTATWSADGNWLIAGNKIWDDDGRALGTVGDQSSWVKSTFWSASGAFVGTLENDRSLRLWRSRGYQLMMTMYFAGSGEAAILYPDGTAFVAGGSLTSMFRLIDNNEPVSSMAGYDHLFRSDGALPR